MTQPKGSEGKEYWEREDPRKWNQMNGSFDIYGNFIIIFWVDGEVTKGK